MTTWPLTLVAIGAATAIAGAIAALFAGERNAMRVLLVACCAASVMAFVSGIGTLLGGPSGAHTLWTLPIFGPIAVKTTPLGALFTCISAMVYFPTSIYTLRYMDRYAHEYSMRAFAAWYCLLLAAIVCLPICDDTVSFFIVWELVAIVSAALVAYEWRREDRARAAFVMLAMSEAGTVAALVAVLVAQHASGSLLFAYKGMPLAPFASWAVFLLSLFGFGVKAGLLPVNSWLPRAHPLAPGNVSALLSAVILNLGVYGILLVDTRLAPIALPSEGVALMLVGSATALVGILYASIDDDVKAMLAYSSIENIGIAITGLGAGFVFMTMHRPLFAAIGFAAGMYHLLNHSAYKGLLFLTASTIDAQTGTRSMNRLGGLIRLLPVTAALFLVGALSIAAIPPFNGYTSEWLTFQSLLRAVEIAQAPIRVVFALCGAALALTAALSVTCFVKAFGMTFLGRPRSDVAGKGEPAMSMRLGTLLLAIACAALGVFPTYVLPLLDRGIAAIVGDQTVNAALVPAFFHPNTPSAQLPSDFVATFGALGAQLGQHFMPGRGLVIMLRGDNADPVVFAMATTYLVAVIGVLLLGLWIAVRIFTGKRRATRAIPWAGGLNPLPPEMSYTATGFSNPVRVIFDAIFNPQTGDEDRETIYTHFRAAIRRPRQDVFPADRVLVVPATNAVRRIAALLAGIHHGRLALYVAYAIGTLLVALTIVTITG